jgi:hypothetical protein
MCMDAMRTLHILQCALPYDPDMTGARSQLSSPPSEKMVAASDAGLLPLPYNPIRPSGPSSFPATSAARNCGSGGTLVAMGTSTSRNTGSHRLSD